MSEKMGKECMLMLHTWLFAAGSGVEVLGALLLASVFCTSFL